DVMKLAGSIKTEKGTLLDDQALREKLADWHVASAGLRYTRFRTLTALSRGQTPGPEASIAKLVAGAKSQDMAATAPDLMDQLGIVSDPTVAPAEAAFQRLFLGSPGIRIAGGTDEILQNIIAERVLGLPGEIRVDKDKAFKDLPSGSR